MTESFKCIDTWQMRRYFIVKMWIAVAAAGEVKSAKTTRLLSGQEWLESLRKRRVVNIQKAR